MIPYYGPGRVEMMFAHRSFLDYGIPVSGSSDNPCGPYEPLLAIQSCVTRKSTGGESLGSRQKITVEEALYLSKLCKTVTVVHRRHEFRASKIMQERLLKTPNVKVVWDSEVVDVLGDAKVEAVRVRNVRTGATADLKAQGLFLAIGHAPATDVFKGQLSLEKDYVVLHPHDGYQTSTSVDGVFAAGDVHDHRYRQAVTAAGFGCMAALDVEKWLQAHE